MPFVGRLKRLPEVVVFPNKLAVGAPAPKREVPPKREVLPKSGLANIGLKLEPNRELVVPKSEQ